MSFTSSGIYLLLLVLWKRVTGKLSLRKTDFSQHVVRLWSMLLGKLAFDLSPKKNELKCLLSSNYFSLHLLPKSGHHSVVFIQWFWNNFYMPEVNLTWFFSSRLATKHTWTVLLSIFFLEQTAREPNRDFTQREMLIHNR